MNKTEIFLILGGFAVGMGSAVLAKWIAAYRSRRSTVKTPIQSETSIQSQTNTDKWTLDEIMAREG